MLQTISTILLYGFTITIPFMPQNIKMKKITKNQMSVCWEYKNDRIHFEMEAPTSGWVTIGFNTRNQIIGSYLIMGNIIEGKVNVVEHYTVLMGDYRPFSQIGSTINVTDISGLERRGFTKIRFSLPIKTASKYGVDFTPDRKYTIHLAYSREDDFQHHSMMRTYVSGIRMGEL